MTNHWPTSDDPKKCAFSRWWHAMGEIFGREWYDKNGPEPGALWKQSLSEISMATANLIIQHYRKAGRAFAPNQSEVMNLAVTLHKTTMTRPAPSFMPEPNVVEQAQRESDAKLYAWRTEYERAHPGATKRESMIAYLREHGLVKRLQQYAPNVLTDQEACEERSAIQAESTQP